MRFNKFLSTYDQYAHVQKKVAEKLSRFFSKGEEFSSVLEIGCGTGIYTRELGKVINFETIILNDICDTEEYFSHMEKSSFLKGDMDNLPLESCSLITSSSAFQWSSDLNKLLENISSAGERLVFSIYVSGNLAEIESHFGISLKYHDEIGILEILKKYFVNIESETEEITLDFTTPMNALKHLKYTGVTGIGEVSSINKIKTFNSAKLTYKIAYFNCFKSTKE